MKVCVFGLWHLGTVTAACLADAGHDVVGLDDDTQIIAGLQQGNPPLFEPGLEDLVKRGMAANKLSFTTDAASALRGADVLWVTFDTPVDEDDRADVDAVVQRVVGLFPHLPDDVLVLISSQLPVGSIARLEALHELSNTGRRAHFACSPENLRLGKAIEVFTNPDRIIVGTRTTQDREIVAQLLNPITERIEWMSVESAEMTKHAVNAFLAASISFMNEVASLCERVGADARDVERGLKTESRIGPRAYLRPGGAFAGGTLARDIAFLQQVGQRVDVPVNLLSAVETSNNAHKKWEYRRLWHLLGELSGKTVTILGLTYKPGTDTLRRSSAVTLAQALRDVGAIVHAYDPMVQTLPEALQDVIKIKDSAAAALNVADAAVIMTAWPQFKEISATQFSASMRQALVLDANQFLADNLQGQPDIQYYAVGKP